MTLSDIASLIESGLGGGGLLPMLVEVSFPLIPALLGKIPYPLLSSSHEAH